VTGCVEGGGVVLAACFVVAAGCASLEAGTARRGGSRR
jgi:hypothetical protein